MTIEGLASALEDLVRRRLARGHAVDPAVVEDAARVTFLAITHAAWDSQHGEGLVLRFVAALLRAVARPWRDKDLDLDLRIGKAITDASSRTGRGEVELQVRYNTTLQTIVNVPDYIQHAAAALVAGIEGWAMPDSHGAVLELAAEMWLATTTERGDFHRGVLGLPSIDDSADILVS